VPDRIEPNAPSSPQWSLNEQPVEPHAVASEAENEHVTIHQAFEPSNVAEPAVGTVQAETDEPREARKGWWQRRFKI
jgi:hypothetical protein